MKTSGKIFLGLSALLLVAGIPTGYAIQLNKSNASLENKNVELSQTIEDKDTALNNANAEMDNYKDIIENLGTNKLCCVNFEVKGEIIDTEAVLSGECVARTPKVSISNIIFNGWKLEDGTSVDPLTHPVNDNMTFYADYSQQYSTQIMYVNGGTNAGSVKKITSHTVPETLTHSLFDESWTYVGDYINGKLYAPGETCNFEDVQDPTKTIQIYVVFTKTITATFKVDDQIVKTQDFNLFNYPVAQSYIKIDPTTIEAPTKEGYTFKGWAIEGAEGTIINFSKKSLDENTVFVAVFE